MRGVVATHWVEAGCIGDVLTGVNADWQDLAETRRSTSRSSAAASSDAASRATRRCAACGWRSFERRDFGSGTTSASTRIVHGGLRYLEMLDFRLVRLDLRERETLLRIAPHLVRRSSS